MNLFKQTKQDRDYLALQELLKPVEEQDEATGILSKPKKPEDEESMVTGFFSSMFDRSKQRSAELAQEMQEQQRISEEQEISDYLRRTSISDALYDELKLPNPAYGGLKIVEDRPMTEAELEQYAPLIDLANDIMEETITVKELGAMNRMDQEAFLKSLSDLKVNERGSSFEGDTFQVASSREEFLRDLMKKREADTAKPKDDEASRLKEFLLREETDSTSDDVKPVDTTTIDADGGAAPSGKGIMSPRLDGKDGDMSVPTKYGTAVFEMSTDLKKTEGVDPHIGADWENVTLALGIVPTSGLKIDGMVVPSDRAKRGKWLKKNGYVNSEGKPTEKFSSASIDTSGAVKDGVKRSDYSSDTEWSAAVIDNFKKGAEEKVEGFNDLGTKEQKAIIDLAWNMGVGGLDYSGNKAFIGELKKAPEDRDVAVMLEAGKHVTEGGKVMRGLARRKALFVNENIDNPDLKIVKIKQTSRGNKTYHTYINALGQSVKTIELGKRHSGSPDGIIDVATGEEIEVTSPRPMLRPDDFEIASN